MGDGEESVQEGGVCTGVEGEEPVLGGRSVSGQKAVEFVQGGEVPGL